MVPALGPDMPTHFGVQINGPTVISPWPAKENAVLCIFGRQPALNKYKTARLVSRKTHRRRQIPVTLAADLAIVKNGRGLPEDEIDVALDIAILVILSS